MAVKDRVKVRIPDITTELLDEYTQTATDRINLRVGVTILPPELESVAVEVVCALYNRKYHEGIKSENVDTFSVSFVDNVLNKYEKDFNLYLQMKQTQDNAMRGKLRFL